MNTQNKQHLLQIFKIIAISVISLGGFVGVNYYEWTQFHFYTSRMGSLPSLPLYTFAFLKFFFLSFGLYFLFRFVHKNLANIKWLQYVNIFYFGFLWFFIFWITFYLALEFARYDILWFLPNLWSFTNIFLEKFFIFLLYSCLIYFPFILIWAIVAGFY